MLKFLSPVTSCSRYKDVAKVLRNQQLHLLPSSRILYYCNRMYRFYMVYRQLLLSRRADSCWQWRITEGGITVKSGQDSIHELIIWKANPFVASVTCSRCQIAFKWSVKFWLQLFSLRWDGKYFNGWNFYLGILQIQENWAGRNFITNSRVYSLLMTQAKMQTEINNN